MHLKKHLPEIVKKYDSDQVFRTMCTQAFSHVLSQIPKLEQPGAIKVADLNSDKRQELLNIIKPEWWDVNTNRQKNYPSQQHTKNILLVNFEKHIAREDEVVQDQKSKLSPFALRHHSAVKPFLDFASSFAHNVGKGILRNTTIVNLLPGKHVFSHYDSGVYYMIRDRYHLVLYSPKGSRTLFEEEEYIFKEGEIWWYNNKLFHEAYNDSDEPRIHMIFDVLPYKNVEYEKYLIDMFYEDNKLKVYGEDYNK